MVLGRLTGWQVSGPAGRWGEAAGREASGKESSCRQKALTPASQEEERKSHSCRQGQGGAQLVSGKARTKVNQEIIIQNRVERPQNSSLKELLPGHLCSSVSLCGPAPSGADKA